MKIWHFFLVLLWPQWSFSQVCLSENSSIDSSCSCQAKNNCYKLYSPEYLQSLKKVSATSPKTIKAIAINQKATSAAFNKIMSNRPLTEQDLDAVRREAAVLNKLNQANLSLLNSVRAKKGKAPLQPQRDAQKFDKNFLSSLPIDLQKKFTKGSFTVSDGKFSSTPNPTPGIESEGEGEEVIGIDTTAETSFDAPVLDEASELEARVSNELQKDFDYRSEISEEKTKPLFLLISDRYQKVILKPDSLRYHLDTDQERSRKSEIKEDIRKMIELRRKNF